MAMTDGPDHDGANFDNALSGESCLREATDCRCLFQFGEWAFDVASQLQRFINVLQLESRERVEGALLELSAALPSPPDRVSQVWLGEKLAHTFDRAAGVFHSREGCRPGCGMPAMPLLRFDQRLDRVGHPLIVLQWAARFLSSFDTHHRRIGVPVRAARLLRRPCAVKRTKDLGWLADHLDVSPATLERWFVDRYGLTPKSFHTRVRIRRAALLLRGSSDKVQYIGGLVGYRSATNFYAALEGCTGLTPSEMRGLPESEFLQLLDTVLQTDPAILHSRSETSVSDRVHPTRA
jgi:AraC-like DNA-binding protein